MAFNPFHAFRKHQKVLLACITLVAMFSFILCSGLASKSDVVFEFFANLFGGKVRYPPVTTLYGRSVNTAEVAALHRQRQLAQEALGAAYGLAGAELQKKLKDKLGDLKETSPEAQKEIRDLQMQQQQLQDLLLWREIMMFQDMGKLDNLLDFMVWRQQAEKLGVVLTPEALNEALKRLTLNTVDVPKLYQAMRDNRNYGTLKLEELQHALGEEFQVQIAQAALLGYEPGVRQSLVEVPAPVTPYEFRNRYIHLRTGLDVALVPVPVKPNEEKTLSEQDQREMRALYNLYKDREPAPDQSTPGFKVPRKLRVEWVAARPDDPYFQKVAAEWRKALYDVQRGPGGFVPTPAGGSLGPVLSQALFNSAFNARELVAYNDLKGWNSPYKLPSWTEPGYAAGIYTTRPRVENAAGLVGQLVSAGVNPGLPLDGIAALGNYQFRIIHRNRDDKDFEAFVSRSVKEKEPQETLVQAGVLVSLLGGHLAPLGAAAAAMDPSQSDRYLPMNLLREQAAKAADLSLSKDVMVGTLTEFRKNLDERRGTPAKARAWLDGDKSAEGAIKKNGLRHELMGGKPEDRYALAKDKTLAPLLEAWRREQRLPDTKQEDFAKLFFGPEPALYRPASLPPVERDADRDLAWKNAEEVFLYWTVEDEKAYVPTYEEAKAQVEAAWKLQKARPASRKEAEQLLAKLQGTDGDLRRIRDVAAQARTEVIRLPGEVSRQVAGKSSPNPMAPKSYESYKFPDAPDGPTYPRTSEWLDKILAMKKKGDAVLLVNEPETVFYLAVALDNPDVPSEATIARAYGTTPFGDPLYAKMVQDRQKEHREQAIKELRVASGAPLTAEQDYKVPDDVRKQFAGKGGGGEVGE
jgi:hypothetical protein